MISVQFKAIMFHLNPNCSNKVPFDLSKFIIQIMPGSQPPNFNNWRKSFFFVYYSSKCRCPQWKISSEKLEISIKKKKQ